MLSFDLGVLPPGLEETGSNKSFLGFLSCFKPNVLPAGSLVVGVNVFTIVFFFISGLGLLTFFEL